VAPELASPEIDPEDAALPVLLSPALDPDAEPADPVLEPAPPPPPDPAEDPLEELDWGAAAGATDMSESAVCPRP